ncbi:MAG TPA: polysaccharide biosynthesis/export family protein, partial [Candidatus Krumholzibacterium sp.]|nr:polysaccharide biosynthesis/export family protein [Candidatus Krumholzibacterium sp.]
MKLEYLSVSLIALLLAMAAAHPVAAQTDRAKILEDAAAKEEIVEKADEQRQTGTGLHQRAAVPRLEQAVDPATYVLGPYDILLLNIVGPEPRSMQLVVLPEGYVFIPGIGGLRADGLSLADFREELSAVVDRYFKNIEMFCYLQQPRTFRVFVTGEVPSPGAVEVTAVERVSDAIEKAGSINSPGSNRQVLLERDGDTLRVDILKFVLEGDFSSNPFLSNGDRIHVPVAAMHVVVRGSVNR